MIKFRNFLDIIKKKLKLKNKSRDIVIKLNIFLPADLSNLCIEIPIDEEDRNNEPL